VIDRAADYKAPGRFGNKGVEIEFADSERSTYKLYYFSVNLSDERLSENKPFLAYLSRLKGTTTLLKATSYMTHRPEFSLIRDQILASSAAILQDDSGIPYRYFRLALGRSSFTAITAVPTEASAGSNNPTCDERSNRPGQSHRPFTWAMGTQELRQICS
jgi:hypothetical protein